MNLTVSPMKHLSLICAVLSLCACANRGESLAAYDERMKREDPQFYAAMIERAKLRNEQRTEVMRVSITCFNHGNYGATNFAVEEVAFAQIARDMIGGPFGCSGVLALG